MRMQDQGSTRLRTVGDTLTVVQRVHVPAGALVQPRDPVDSLLVSILGQPQVEREGDSVRIAYTLAVWAPGKHELRIPGAIVIVPGGTVDTLSDATVSLSVASLLPEGARADTLAPQQARVWLPRSERSTLPFLVVLLPLVVFLLALARWWRRRGRAVPCVPRMTESAADRSTRLNRWLEAGEVLLVIDHLVPLVPGSEAGRVWRDEVAKRRYSPNAPLALRSLASEGIALVQESERGR